MQEGQVIGGRYRIGKKLGQGGMGSVYAAAHVVTGKSLAIKILQRDLVEDKSARRRLLREAQIAAKVEHPNIVNIYDVGQEDDAIYLVMELLRGESFQEWIASHDKPHPEELLRVILPALRGLAALHAQGIIHRDLKPANIFVLAEEDAHRAKLLDFGIARDSQTTLTLTKPGQVLGTPAYMAPEQLNGASDVDERADVYAVGVLLYEAFSGRRPFDSNTLTSLIAQILEGKTEPLSAVRPDLPERLSKIVHKAMASDASERTRTVGELANELAAFASKGADDWQRIEAKTQSAGARPSLGLLVAGAIGILAVGGWLVLKDPPTEQSEGEAASSAASAAAPPDDGVETATIPTPDAGAEATPEVDAGAPTANEPPAAEDAGSAEAPPARRTRRRASRRRRPQGNSSSSTAPSNTAPTGRGLSFSEDEF